MIRKDLSPGMIRVKSKLPLYGFENAQFQIHVKHRIYVFTQNYYLEEAISVMLFLSSLNAECTTVAKWVYV